MKHCSSSLIMRYKPMKGDELTLYFASENPNQIIDRIKYNINSLITYEKNKHNTQRFKELFDEEKKYPYDVALALMTGFNDKSKLEDNNPSSYWEYAHYKYFSTRINMNVCDL